MPAEPSTCICCGAPFRDGATQGHCPACLLELAVFGDASLKKPPAIGQVGDYEILEEIARGGMGIVFKARQLSVNRMVAIKMILDGQLASQEATERFMREAEAAANLDHPHIVPIYEVSEVDTERFFVMKLIDGQNLAQRLADLRLSENPAQQKVIAQLVLKITRALAYAHEHGVLHRDLKPSNILIDQHGEPFLTDFGLAKVDSQDKQLTVTVAVLGSPSYMAPEQAQNGIKGATTAADIYGAGAILYELLTGKPPFEGATPMETLQKVIHESPRPLQDLQPLVDRDLETLCLKCLEKEPGRRYASMSALADELERYLAGEPIQARPVGALETSLRWCRRNPALAAVGAIAIISTIAGVSGVLWQWQEAKEARQLAEAERDEARWETYQAKLTAASSAAQQFDIADLQSALTSAPEEHRHWEWHYLNSLLKAPYRTLPAPFGKPSSIGFDATEQFVGQKFFLDDQTAGNNVATVWNIAAGTPWWSLPPESNLADDLSHVTQLDADGTLTVSDPRTKTTLLSLPPTGNFVPTSIGVTRSDNHILLQSEDQIAVVHVLTGFTVSLPRHPEIGGPRVVAVLGEDSPLVLINDHAHFVYDSKTGEEIARYPSLASGRTLAVTPDNTHAAIGGLYPDNDILLLDLITGEVTGRFTGHSNDTLSIAFDQTSTRMVSGSVDQTVRLWDVPAQREIAWMPGHRGGVRRVTFSPSGNIIASFSRDHTVRLWNSSDGKPLEVLMGHRSEPSSLHFSPSGRMLASSDTDGMRLWKLDENRTWLHGHESFVYDVDFSPDGDHIASTSWDKTTKIWDTAGEGQSQTYDLGAIGLGVAYSPNGRFLATATLNKLIWWDLHQDQHSQEKPHDIGEIVWSKLSPSFSPDSSKVALGLLDKIAVWDTASGKLLHELTIEGLRQVTDTCFTRDGKHLVSSSDQQILVWDLSTSAVIAEMTVGKALSIEFNQGGSLMAISMATGGVTVWDAKRYEKIATLPHACAVFSTTFNQDASRLFTAGEDGIIRVWDLTHFQQVGSLHGHQRYVHSLALSPDDETLGSASGDHTVKLWSAKR